VRHALRNNYEKLRSLLTETKGLVVAYSGGVDSSLLLKVATEVLGNRVLAVIATSETYPEEEVEAAIRLAQALGARYRVIHTEELQQEQFAGNPPDRCYHCKLELFGKLRAIAREEGLPTVADGANLDDLGDYRPGLRAGRELGIRSPLRETGFTKADVRELSRELGLPTWNKPSLACLASRFPYGDRITTDKLQQVAAAERALKALGFVQVRVRHYGAIARLELEPDDLPAAVLPETRARIIAALRAAGYQYIALDLDGYRTGSMNETLREGTHGDKVDPTALVEDVRSGR
jgi:uncharacterized protein